ncbi:DNA topoisomerase [Marinobacter gelidimuriae]|uniref:DNA topoisomerase n=1 Tax=Marinobacter gelidimuriae TaxID=2739064 RepID=UPI0009D9DDAC|nr:DNA topoisomerase [Marinobacter gelidimuriae]
MIGYTISPALSKRAGLTLSAGRVQSVAVGFVVNRERAITRFRSRAYQTLTLRLAGHPNIKATPNLKPFVSENEKLWHLTQVRSDTALHTRKGCYQNRSGCHRRSKSGWFGNRWAKVAHHPDTCRRRQRGIGVTSDSEVSWLLIQTVNCQQGFQSLHC